MSENTRTTEKELSKMHSVLNSYKRARRRYGAQLKRAFSRIESAGEQTSQQFKLDYEKAQEEYKRLNQQIEWAEKKISRLKHKLNCNKKGNLKHNPFQQLANLKLTE